MPEADLSSEEIDSYRRCVGRSLVETDMVSVDVIRRIAAALGASWDESAPLEEANPTRLVFAAPLVDSQWIEALHLAQHEVV